jgi:hypothetical protein
MKLKLDSKLATQAEDSLGLHARPLYDRPGARIVGVFELAHVERTQPAPDADKEASVKLRITGLEIANSEQEPHVRDAMRALFLHRTAQGTLDPEGEIELSDRTIDLTAGMLHAVEAARYRTGVRHWQEYAGNAVSQSKRPTVSDLLAELRTIRDGLAALAGGAITPDD